MKDEYKNFKVAWKVQLYSIHSFEEEIISVSTSEVGNDLHYPVINFEVNINSYPKLKFAQRGEVMFVSGEIKKASKTYFELKNCTIDFENK